MSRSDAPAARDEVRGPEGASALDHGLRPQPRGRDTWAGAIGILVFGSLWCLLPLCGIARSVSDLEREWRLPQEGVTTDGLVVARRVETDAEGSTSHHITLAYDAPAGAPLRPRLGAAGGGLGGGGGVWCQSDDRVPGGVLCPGRALCGGRGRQWHPVVAAGLGRPTSDGASGGVLAAALG